MRVRVRLRVRLRVRVSVHAGVDRDVRVVRQQQRDVLPLACDVSRHEGDEARLPTTGLEPRTGERAREGRVESRRGGQL